MSRSARILVVWALLSGWTGAPCQTAAPSDWAQAAYEALAAGEAAQAADLFARALASPRSLPRARCFQWAADWGFLLENLQRPAAAVDAFETALACQDDAMVRRALAYRLKALGREKAAAEAFREALEEDPTAPSAQRLLLRREVRNLETAVSGGAFAQLRAETGGPDVQLVGPVLVGSQGGADLAVRPARLGAPRWLAGARLTGRLLWAFDGATLAAVDDSLQAGVGVQVKPFSGLNLVLGAERLVAIGAFARNDWLLRLSYSAGRGYERPAAQTRWLFYSLYADAALINPALPEWIFAGDARAGLGWQMHPRLAVRPFAALTATQQAGAIGSPGLYEAGPGVSLIAAPPGSATRASAIALEVELRWRQKLAGNAGNRSGLTVTLALRF